MAKLIYDSSFGFKTKIAKPSDKMNDASMIQKGEKMENKTEQN